MFSAPWSRNKRIQKMNIAATASSNNKSISFNKKEILPTIIEVLDNGYRWEDGLFIRKLMLNGISGYIVYHFGFTPLVKVRSTTAAEDSQMEDD